MTSVSRSTSAAASATTVTGPNRSPTVSTASQVIARTRTPQDSQLKWPVLLTTVAVGGMAALLWLHPFGWVTSAILAGSVFLFTMSFNVMNYQMKSDIEKQMMSFECSSLARMLPVAENYHEINLSGLKLRKGKIPTEAKLIVSALPNKKCEWNSVPKGKIGVVVANLQEEELDPRGPVQVLTEADWKAKDGETQFYWNQTKDLELVPPEKLDIVADLLYNNGISQGKGAITHCRGGSGRSAMGAAACMLKYFVHQDDSPLTIEEVCARIKSSRKKSSIWNKLPGLIAFSEHIKKTHIQAPISENVSTYASELDAMGKSGQKPKLSKEKIKKLLEI